MVESRRVAHSRVLLECPYGWFWYYGDRVFQQVRRTGRPITPGPLPPRASFTLSHTRAELRQLTRPAGDIEALLRRHIPYETYQAAYLAGILGVEAFAAAKEAEALTGEPSVPADAGEEAEEEAVPRRPQKKSKGIAARAEARVISENLPKLHWRIPVINAQGEDGTVSLQRPQRIPRHLTAPVNF